MGLPRYHLLQPVKATARPGRTRRGARLRLRARPAVQEKPTPILDRRWSLLAWPAPTENGLRQGHLLALTALQERQEQEREARKPPFAQLHVLQDSTRWRAQLLVRPAQQELTAIQLDLRLQHVAAAARPGRTRRGARLRLLARPALQELTAIQLDLRLQHVAATALQERTAQVVALRTLVPAVARPGRTRRGARLRLLVRLALQGRTAQVVALRTLVLAVARPGRTRRGARLRLLARLALQELTAIQLD